MEISTDILYIVTSLLAVTALLLLVYSVSKANQAAELKVELQKLNSELTGARESITSLTADRKSLESRLEEKEMVFNSVSGQLDESRKEIQELNRRILSDQSTISELKTTIEKERESSKEKLQLLNLHLKLTQILYKFQELN